LSRRFRNRSVASWSVAFGRFEHHILHLSDISLSFLKLVEQESDVEHEGETDASVS
jgi:hypothetical protein